MEKKIKKSIKIGEFKNNPNIKFNSYILKYDEFPGEVAEIFLSYSNNKIYIITNNNNILDIYETFDNLNIHKISSLKKHKEKIEVVKYFIDPKNHSQYLVSADLNKIYIWDIDNNFNKKYKINYSDYYDYYDSKLIDCLLFFSNDIIDEDYIFTSNSFEKEGINSYISETKMFSFDNEYIESVQSVKGYLYHLLLWHDKINHNCYIVILTIKYIAIINLLDEKLYCELDNYTGDFDFNLNANKADHAYIYKEDNNYYLVDLNYATITIWDLYKKCQFKRINTKFEIFNERLNKDDIYQLKHLVKWNNKYMIVINKHCSYDHGKKEYSFIQIIDLEEGKPISKMGKEKDEKEYIRFMKTLIHPIYGESLILVDKFIGVQLWTTLKTE